ncbi:MAG TPA: MFS transporter [Paludibacter sp.]|jgi:FHS family L-fucose permease-like MFS transporter|nr:MAG: L-fucose-proton symporter [Bacteroidetes bacterium ADurb.Bin174]HQB27436.1 MFS transporter [Paludibacter sp.]
MNNVKKSYVLPIAMMFALFAMISFVTGLSNPLGVIIKNQPGVQNWMSQLGNFANFLAYLFMGLPAGLVLKRKGYKFTALSAIAVGFLGVGIQLISGLMPYTKGDNFLPIFMVYLTGAFVSGFSMCMLNTVVNPLLNTLGGGGKRGNQLIQFGGSLNSLAATIVPILGGYLIADVARATLKDAIPALLIAMGIFAVAFIVLAFVKIPEPHLEKKSEKVVEKDKYSAMSFRHFVLGTIAIFIYVGVEVGIPNFINLFLTAPKDASTAGMAMDAGAAGTVVGTYWFLMLIGRLLGGSLGGKISSRAQLTFVSALALILVVTGIFLPSNISISMPVFKADISFGLQVVPLSVFFFVLCGLCTSVMWGTIFNLAVEGIGKYTALGSGIFMVMVVGGGVLPLIQGLVADLSLSYMVSYWVIAAGLLFILYYATIGHKNVNTDIPVE